MRLMCFRNVSILCLALSFYPFIIRSVSLLYCLCLLACVCLWMWMYVILATIEPSLIPYLIFKWEISDSTWKITILMNSNGHVSISFDKKEIPGCGVRTSWALFPSICCAQKKTFSVLSDLIRSNKKSNGKTKRGIEKSQQPPIA